MTVHAPTPAAKHDGPRFTIVTAVYDVARYLPDFIASIDRQTLPADQIQVVAVDDGSTDESLALLEEWSARRPDTVTVLSKENGGQSSARNLGLKHARGEWVTFTDPDDTLDPDYFEVVRDFLDGHPKTDLVMTNLLLHEEEHDRIRDAHPRRYMFRGGDHLVDLDRFPDHYPGSAPSSFFRNDRIARMGLEFDERVRPNFEDGHFSSHYILGGSTALVGFLPSARYLYRKRADQSSTLQRSVADPDRFVAAPRYGYLEVLDSASRSRGAVPEWLQNFILYELSWYFSSEDRMSGRPTAAVGEVGKEFVSVLSQIAALLDPDVVYSFRARPFAGPWREVLTHALRDESWHSPYVVTTAYDSERHLVRLSYRYTGEAPLEEFLFRGLPVEPVAAKRRGIDYFGATLVRERIAWVPARGTLRVRLNGRTLEIRSEYPGAVRTTARMADLTRLSSGSSRAVAGRARQRWPRFAVPKLARTKLVRRVVGRPWVLVDRLHDSADSAEIVFRHLRKHRRDINAWFVVERGTPDWMRLKSEGYKRVVSPESILWKVLMANAEAVISSHVDVPIHRPPSIVEHVEPGWKFAFLQHGVIKDDLSRWLNGKSLDLFVTSTPDEHESIVGDDTPYVFTSKEVKMTGLPRFDALRAVDEQIPEDHKNLVVVAPTWRYWLNPPLKKGSQRREVIEGFEETEFARAWSSLLRSPELKQAVDAAGMRLAFLPHPNIQPALHLLDVPDYVEKLTFVDQDVQGLFARCRVMVTDYSSMAFNTAYLDRAAVYYQFDAEQVQSGGHVGRKGYFDYRTHGFGPVVEDHDGAVNAVIEAIRRGGVSGTEYQARIDRAFPQRDGRSSARVVAEIERVLGRRT